MKRIVAGTVIVVAVTLAMPRTAHAGPASVEEQLLALINAGRVAIGLEMHDGLRAVARAHSQDMDKADGLNHNGAAGRFDRASPDPPEPNGAPDDGFTGVWCENVAWVGGGLEKDVAKRMYDGWVASPPHNTCMNNPTMTAAGVGVYTRNGEWWATLEASQDATLPDGKSQPGSPAAEPKKPPPPPARTDTPPTSDAARASERPSQLSVAASTPSAPDPTASARASLRAQNPPRAMPSLPEPEGPFPDWLAATAAGSVVAAAMAAWMATRARRPQVAV